MCVRIIILSLLLPFLFYVRMFSQTNDLGSWNILNIKYKWDSKWNVFGEAQIRSLLFYNYFHYYEYKGGVEYNLFKDVRITLGAGSYQTYKEGGNFIEPKNNDEFRLWPQVILFQTIGKVSVEQRYRTEARFTRDGYRNRFRYRLGVAYPFGKEQYGNKPFLFSVSDEIFFTNTEPYFERNRLLFAFNYRCAQTVTLQIGYLHQFDYKINDETGRDFLVIGLYYEMIRTQPSVQRSKMEMIDN